MWHWLNAELWGPLWPNVVAPSLWTLVGITASHVRQERRRDERHEDMKQHVTATAGGPDGQADTP